ncbi:LAGLIDADG family homing endonuclease [Candidatus Nitrosotenuis uzonensis]|uniref:DNA helicase n=1 Tax=Candidatus Nitrosotenuis uzonensis TaxID=1407055 RepID=V6ARI2_9ARCH|nr:LAGLIDADG family homing endonuclease [Candidatus Nitrosotenuis uzonensis]CDI05130.1 putative MCM family protein [Candidatus Nitrosotenuis uzonensis]
MTLETQTQSALIDQIQNFLASFKDKSGTFHYVEEIDQMMAKQTKYIVVDYNDVVSQKEIEVKFNLEPDAVLYAFSRAIKNILEERFPDYAQKISDDIRVRIANYPIQRSLRQINAEVIGKMTSVSGMVVRASEVKPLAKNMVYKCPEGHLTEIPLERGMMIFTPTKCSHEKCSQRDLRIDPETSKFIDFQIVRLQELPEDLPPGQLPHYVDVTIKQDLVDNARPGDRIILTGIVRIEQEQITGTRVHSGLHRLRIEGNNIEFLGGKGSKNSRRSEREEISPEEEKIIKSLARSPDVYERLIGSFAPHIQGHAIIKESILLLMVGSTQRVLQDGTKIRGDINVFLVGDPGCLDGSTKVILADGRIVDLESLGKNHLEEINVRMQHEYGDDTATVFHKYENQKVIEIVTETGKNIIGTYNHPLFTKNGWKRLDELKEGDELRTITHIPCTIKNYVPTDFGVVTRSAYHGKIPEFVNEELAAFMGFLTGDGWCRTNGYRIDFIVSQKEEDLLQPLLQMGKNLFGLEPKISKRGYPGQLVMMNDGRQITRTMYVTNVEYNSKNVVEMLEFLKGGSCGRHVPSSIFQSPNSVVASYLKWLFEADGTVFNMGRARRAIQLRSTSIRLLRDVQMLLLRFGIHSRIIQHETGSNLVIRRGTSIVKYAKHVGFVSNTKASRLNDLVRWALETRRNQRHDEEYEKIVKINYLTRSQIVYDVEIPKTHKFIANGILSHNTAKSEMLKFCARVAPRGLYTSGRGSTAAGLTAAVVRDKSGILMLEAGAVVLGDQGLVCIDEFDKMKPEDRSALHEVMEQQSASIAKGGIVATLNARTSILAAANPMYGKYDPFKNITENVALPIPLLTRFDLIFVVRDIPSKEKDRNIAKHIIGMHKKSSSDTRSLIDVDIFTKYLSYCKRIDPILTPEAEEKILEYYLKMRNVESEEMITVTPRQLGGLVRLATARARLLQKDQVDGEDADRAIFLIQSMLEDAGVDVNTGKVDLGVLQGRPHSEVSKLQLFMDVLKSLEGDSKTAVEEKLFVKELVKTTKFTEEEARNFIRRMLREASIYESKPGHYNRV